MNDLVGRCIDAATEVPEFSYGNGMYYADIPAIVRAVIATIGAGLTREHAEALSQQARLYRFSGRDTLPRLLEEATAVIAAIVEANRHD